MLKPHPPGPQNVSVYEGGVFKEVIKLNKPVKVAPNQIGPVSL